MVVRNVCQVRVGRFTAFTAATFALGTVLASSGAAEAHSRHFFHRHAYSEHIPHEGRVAVGSYAPNYSAIVLDANTGRTLYDVNADAPRHPASITKVMTLYLLFEQMEKGRIGLDTMLQVSAHAAGQSPTKLGVPAGGEISVDNAIKAIVTRSANDMAVTVAENLAGDELSFARLMTEKAHALGMNHTFYHNASGLPDMRQITTARDLTILGRAIHDRFPRYYKFFSTPSFVYHGQTIGSHNHLMARMAGMDGIKTGYTNASGFNLLSSISLGGRHVIGVVMGGKSAAGRDSIMQGLLESHFEEASATPSTRVAEGVPVEEAAETPRRAVPEPPEARQAEAPASREDMAQADDDDGEDGAPVERHPPRGPNLIAPDMAVPVPPVERTQVVMRADLPRVAPRPPEDRPRPAFVPGARTIEASRLPGPLSAAERGRITVDGSTSRRVAVGSPGNAAVATATPSSLHWVTGAQPVRLGPSAEDATGKVPAAGRAETISFGGTVDEAAEPRNAKAEMPREEPRPTVAKGEWMIQIGATDNADAAADLLSRARSQSRSALASAKPFTEKVQRGDSTLYRARFAGLDTAEAETACRTLKRSGFACFATRD